jgi:predicted nucleotidyltransferase component of viral defense system
MSMLNGATHKSILIQILKSIYTDTQIASFLGFKGGTALYVFYQLDRHSVDLDFDLIDESKKEIVFERLRDMLKQYGELKEARIKRFSVFFLLSYDDSSHNIKVEINLRKLGSEYEVKSYLGISMRVMVRQDMFAHKLVAMLERLGKTNRDIYDVHFLLKKQWPINTEIIASRTGLAFSDFVEKCCDGLKEMNNRAILNGIGELLRVEQKKWVKQHLLEDTVFLLQLRVD